MDSRFIPHSEADIQEMLARIGVATVDDLYADMPESIVFKGEYNIPEAMSEIELRKHFEKLGKANRSLTVFAGGGVYDHYSPSTVSHLLSRSEFYTAYTPYQPEISQGTLQYIFEYQSMICDLTGMDISNASMYDGATAAAEAVMMMSAAGKKRPRVLISATLLPQVAEVVRTYAKYHGVPITVIPEKDGITDLLFVETELAKGDVAGVLLPQPNRYGIIEVLDGLTEKIHAAKALMTMYADPSTLAVLRTPGEWGADIACGDGQSLGMPMQFGGPYLGFMACKDALIRKLPGRIVGATTDRDGKRCFVLTLQAREQHIRREKATSNICSNQSLMALYATIYMALMGKEGLKEVNELSAKGARYLMTRLVETGHFTPAFDKPFLKEFAMRTDLDIDAINSRLLDNGFMGGLKTESGLVVFAVTEQRTKEEIDNFVTLMLQEKK